VFDFFPTEPKEAVMIPLGELKHISPDTELRTALQLMNRGGVNQLPVMMESQAVGILSRDDVITFLHTIQELGTKAPARET
jgi:CBS domain-containing protein